MSRFNSAGDGPKFGRPWASEAWMEIGLAAAAACFTVAIWVTSDARAITQERSFRQAAAAQTGGARRVTFEPVLIIAAAAR